MSIQKFPTNVSRDVWLAERSKYIGGSEIGYIYGLDDWKANVEFYYEKVGVFNPNREDNIHSFMGKILEDTVANLWQYYDGSQNTIIENYNSGNVIRKSRATNFRYTNTKYPQLSVNVDRLFTDPTRGKSILECKTMIGWVAQMWESGIPPRYVQQLQTYLGVMELEYAELAVLIDGRFPEIYPFEFSKTLFDGIQETTADFWERVLLGREAIKNVDPLSDEVFPILDEFAPEPIYNEAYEKFLKKKYRSTTDDTIIATDTELALARELMRLADESKAVASLQSVAKSRIMEFMGAYEVLDCDEMGKITWRPRKDGVRVFRSSSLKGG